MARPNKRLVIEKRLCKGCGICVGFCPKKVLELQKQKVTLTNEPGCILCGMCELRCPDYAIYLEPLNNEGEEGGGQDA